jgi:XTP/dITP diphosphohydrolase
MQTIKPLLIGSGNTDKAKELAELLHGLPWDIKTLNDFPTIDEPVEDQDTYEGNALLKARYYGKHFDVDCLADDSGLNVDYLDGAPGVYSARYAGENCTYNDNNQKLLGALAEAPWHERSAHFTCCAAIVFLDGTEHVELGEVQGRISIEPFGKNGFGYDPLFVAEGQEITFGEMSPTEKHKISHRAHTFQKMRTYLESRP